MVLLTSLDLLFRFTSSDISFNSSYSTAQITGLTGVLKITLVSTLDKILQVTAVANTNEVYAITADRHYLSAGENINVDGNPSQELMVLHMTNMMDHSLLIEL